MRYLFRRHLGLSLEDASETLPWWEFDLCVSGLTGEFLTEEEEVSDYGR